VTPNAAFIQGGKGKGKKEEEAIQRQMIKEFWFSAEALEEPFSQKLLL